MLSFQIFHPLVFDIPILAAHELCALHLAFPQVHYFVIDLLAVILALTIYALIWVVEQSFAPRHALVPHVRQGVCLLLLLQPHIEIYISQIFSAI